MHETKQLGNNETLSSLWIMISSLLSNQDINKATPKRSCSIRRQKYTAVGRKKGRKEGLGLLVQRVGKQDED